MRFRLILLAMLAGIGAQPVRAAIPHGACVGIGTKAAPQPDAIAGSVSAVYRQAGKRALRLHVWRARNRAGPAPAILLFFGGGWLYGAIEQFAPQARILSDDGIAVILADYRVLCRDGTDPRAAMSDASEAMRFVRRHAVGWGIDPHRLAAGGGSAGGQLALSLAYADGSDVRPDALVLLNPVLDLATAGLADPFRGMDAAAIRDASPIAHRDYPPMLILHGADDPLVPASSVTRFCNSLVARGSACRAMIYPGARHGFFNRGVEDGRWFVATTAAAERFLLAPETFETAPR